MATEDTSAWYDIVGKLKYQWALFNDLLARVRASEPIAKQDVDLWVNYSDLISQATAIRNNVASVVDSLESAYNGLKSAMGLAGFGSPQPLGIAPLIPIAIVAAAVAGIVYWITDAQTYLAKIDAFNKAVAAGATPAQASDSLMNIDITSGNISSTTSNMATIAKALLAAVVVFVGYKAMS